MLICEDSDSIPNQLGSFLGTTCFKICGVIFAKIYAIIKSKVCQFCRLDSLTLVFNGAEINFPSTIRVIGLSFATFSSKISWACLLPRCSTTAIAKARFVLASQRCWWEAADKSIKQQKDHATRDKGFAGFV